MATKSLPGKVESMGGKRKFIPREPRIYQPLKGDGHDGHGEKGRLYFGEVRNPRKKPVRLKEKRRRPLEVNNLFKRSGVTSF